MTLISAPRKGLAGWLIATVLALPGVATATDLTNNLSSVMGGTEAATPTRWLCASFATDSSVHTLNSVTLRLGNSSAGTTQVMIYSSSGLQPGTLVSTLTSPASYSATVAATTFTTTGVPLSASTTYWVVLRPLSGQFDWAWATDSSGSGAGLQHTWGVSEDAGAFWWSQDIYPTQMSVTVDGCVAPVITGQPSGATACPGGTVSLSVTASGSGLGYQWRKGGTPLSDNGHFTGSTTATLTISGATSADAGSYDSVVSNTCESATSNTATVGYCAADFNCSGGTNAVTVQDIFDFLVAYFAGNSIADINGTGGITVQDIFDYLAAYFAGCP